MRHPLEQEVLNDNKECYYLCINIAYLIDQSKHKEKFKDIKENALKKAAGYQMMIDHMEKNIIIYKK